jgi:hypothetical protein
MQINKKYNEMITKYNLINNERHLSINEKYFQEKLKKIGTIKYLLIRVNLQSIIKQVGLVFRCSSHRFFFLSPVINITATNIIVVVC